MTQLTATTARAHQDAIQANYDTRADQYANNSRMQGATSTKLISRLAGRADSWQRVLDIGSGTSGRSSVACKSYVALDLSVAALNVGRCTAPANYDINGTAAMLPFKPAAFDLVISNSTLHWVNVVGGKALFGFAIRQIKRVLRERGCAAISVSGAGTAHAFREAYRTVAMEYRRRLLLHRHLYRPDPIGSLSLDAVVRAFRTSGLRVAEASNEYEPVLFPTPYDYVRAVESYGYEIFTVAFDAERRADAWMQIAEHFASRTSSPYEHDQYVIYVVSEA